MLVKDFAEAWPQRFPRPSEETTRHNVLMVKPFVRRFGGRELAAVSQLEAAGFVRDFPSHGRYARTFMRDARRAKLVDREPFEELRLPSSRGRRDIDALTEAEAWSLVDAVDAVYDGLFALRFRALVAVSLFSGIRACGAAGIAPADVIEGELLSVRVTEKGEKTRESAVLHARARALLLCALGEAVGPVVFRSERGKPLNRWSISRAFDPVKRETGLEAITWHHLRHFCASWMIDQGAQPIDVAIQLHDSTDPDVVLRYYTHASRSASRARLAELAA